MKLHEPHNGHDKPRLTRITLRAHEGVLHQQLESHRESEASTIAIKSVTEVSRRFISVPATGVRLAPTGLYKHNRMGCQSLSQSCWHSSKLAYIFLSECQLCPRSEARTSFIHEHDMLTVIHIQPVFYTFGLSVWAAAPELAM